jgi:hypothetical protein
MKSVISFEWKKFAFNSWTETGSVSFIGNLSERVNSKFE